MSGRGSTAGPVQSGVKTKTPDEKRYLSVRECANQFGLKKTDSLLAAIARGELVAFNIGAGKSRPTWRILPQDLESFLLSRRAVPVAEKHVTKVTRRRYDATVTQYF